MNAFRGEPARGRFHRGNNGLIEMRFNEERAALAGGSEVTAAGLSGDSTGRFE